jgi:hypothetical protein
MIFKIKALRKRANIISLVKPGRSDPAGPIA